MKSIKFTLTFLIFSGLSIGVVQAQKPDCYYLKKAVEYCNESKYPKLIKTLGAFRQYYPNHILFEEAKFTIAWAYLQEKNYSKATSMMSDITLNQGSSRLEDTAFTNEMCNYFQGSGFCGTYLIPTEYVILQHEACIVNAEIGLKLGSTYLAWNSIENADKYYRRWYGCGTADLQEDIRLALLYSRYYRMTSDNDTALQVLLPFTLEPAAFPISYYKELVDSAIFMMKHKFSLEERSKMIDSAIENVHPSIITHGTRTYTNFFITLLGKEIRVAPTYLFGAETPLDDLKSYIRGTDFYLRLTSEK